LTILPISGHDSIFLFKGSILDTEYVQHFVASSAEAVVFFAPATPQDTPGNWVLLSNIAKVFDTKKTWINTNNKK